jgi:aryl-alcohol dehydrogenase-like predicted oxidoreductase
MRKIILGRTNCEVSSISLGTWAFGGESMNGKMAVGWAGQNKKDSSDALTRAWELGINHWDTADVYGNGKSESIIGEMWPKIPRKDIFIATKLGWDKGPHKNWYNPNHMRKNLERSLVNLRTNCVDLLYLHHCNFGENDMYLNDAISTIKQFQIEGKTKYLGLSDWSSERVLKYIKICDPDVVQIYHNVMDNNYITSELKNYVDKNNLGVCFFSPIKHGLLTGKYKNPVKFNDGDHRSRVKEFQDVKILEKLRKNKTLLEERFKKKKNPVMQGLINSLFLDSDTGCVLLGQRDKKQVEMASLLGEKLAPDDAKWVKKLYKF